MTTTTLVKRFAAGTLLATLFALPACSLFPDGQTQPAPDAGTSPDAGTPPDGADPQPAPDGGSDDGGDANCSDWKVGTMTGYDNSDSSDDPNAGSVVEFTGLTERFYDNVPLASIDSSDFPHDKYHYIDIDLDGKIGRVQSWDMCKNEDCPDGNDCCTEAKEEFAQPGYLLDVETRAAKRLFGIDDAENSLFEKVQYRICGEFDPDPIAERYGAHRN